MTKIEHEKQVVAEMIAIYCRHKEGNEELCPYCRELLDYTLQRLEHCRFGEQKTSCKRCPVHCYKPEMRTRIRSVMRYAGPRMLIYHPIDAIKHIV